MDIRVLNPLNTLYKLRTHTAERQKQPLSYEERVKSDRIATIFLVVVLLTATALYHILY